MSGLCADEVEDGVERRDATVADSMLVLLTLLNPVLLPGSVAGILDW